MDKANILVVEDEAIVALDIKNTLESLGYHVCDTVSSGEKAIERAIECKPDLILMDIILKGKMDGTEAAEHIKKKLDIPIIFLTAFGDETSLKRAKIAEPYGYILKPFEERELYITIEVALHKFKIEKKIKEREKLYGTILQNLPFGIIATDINKNILFINENFKDWFDLSEDFEAYNENVADLLKVNNNEVRELLDGPMSKILLLDSKQLEFHNVEVDLNDINIPVDLIFNVIVDENEKIKGMLLIMKKVS